MPRLNRATRRMIKAKSTKLLRNAVYDEFEDTMKIELSMYTDYVKKSNMIESYGNSIYGIRVFKYFPDDRFVKVCISRFDEKEINNWDMIQRIKNDIFGKEAWAIEIYPKESELQNIGNYRWLFVSKGEQFIGLNK
jgi:hypothetical protein